ncbi:glycoside hydrolase family 28 protein [Mucilaginibacter paludis]|uniref:Glycoside hydrolase family 28 n=1 Tax=Mucilaginibacter paludis DSM 18603 TaxID=714943 RepID=H1Y276_9SPHI|nr:glycoside hydrolase family 28 protein [Mucilaginibacter paludis]EHQ26733.1 glycoside hydrolase family 28 [Mucilaginibacter paludis DSM 18603]
MKKLLFISFCIAACGLGAQAQTAGPYSWSNLPKAAVPTFKKDTFNIIKYGAVADGITLNTKSINNAIDACSKNGGGVVLIPQGLWMTGPIVLKSNVNLHIDRAAMVQMTDDKSQYPLVEGNYEGHAAVRNQSPVSGTNLVNIAITGGGIIDGNGTGVWRAIGKDRLTESEWKELVASGGVVSENGKSWYPSQSYAKGNAIKDVSLLKPGKSLSDYEEYKDYFRPNMVVLTGCKKILLSGTTFQNSPNWCLHTLLCEDLTLQDVHVRNPWNAQNGDAIDVESCRNVLVENSTFDAGDDGLCIKSGRDEEGRKRGVPTENVVMRNNIVYRAHGGFVIGSEMSGGARNIFVSDCTFIGTDIGLRFKTARGRGGIVENIYIKNISMRDILHEAILFDMYYMSKAGSTLGLKTFPPVTEATPQFRNFYVSNVACNGAETGIFVRGLPEMSIKNIYLENMVLKADKGAELIEANNISLKNITLESKNTKPLINIENSTQIKLDNIKYTHAEQLLTIQGERSAQIQLINTNTSNAKTKVEFTSGAESKALIK